MIVSGFRQPNNWARFARDCSIGLDLPSPEGCVWVCNGETGSSSDTPRKVVPVTGNRYSSMHIRSAAFPHPKASICPSISVYLSSIPSVRYYHQCTYRVVDHLPNSSAGVDVRRRDGSFVRLPWLGMICEHAAEHLPGLGYAKIRAVDVTDGDGIVRCEWRRLAQGQNVLGWRVEMLSGQGVYGLVDKKLWPIIIGDRGRIGAPRLKMVT